MNDVNDNDLRIQDEMNEDDEELTDEELDALDDLNLDNFTVSTEEIIDNEDDATEIKESIELSTGEIIELPERKEDGTYNTPNASAAPTLIVLINDNDQATKTILTRYIGDSRVFLVDLSEEKTGYKIVPDQAERSYAPLPGSESEYTYDAFDIINLIKAGEKDRKSFIVLAGVDSIIDRMYDNFQDNQLAFKMIFERINKYLKQAYKSGVTIVVTAHNSNDNIADFLEKINTAYDEEDLSL